MVREVRIAGLAVQEWRRSAGEWTKLMSKTPYRKLEVTVDSTLIQRHFNAISTPFQRHFNAISTPFQRHFNADSTLIQRCLNAD